MALLESDLTVLEEIVQADGECMHSARCAICPFRAICLPEFLNPVPPTPQQRKMIALDILAHHALVDDLLLVEEYKRFNK